MVKDKKYKDASEHFRSLLVEELGKNGSELINILKDIILVR